MKLYFKYHQETERTNPHISNVDHIFAVEPPPEERSEKK